MPAFGYATRMVDDYGLQELREVTFDLTSADLRRIADFLVDCANRVDSDEWRASHLHLDTFDRSWSADHPELDLIVINPNPKEPPKGL